MVSFITNNVVKSVSNFNCNENYIMKVSIKILASRKLRLTFIKFKK